MKTFLRRALGTLFVLGLFAGVAFYVFGDDLQDAEFHYEYGRESYRIRVTGSPGNECVRLEREQHHNRARRWAEQDRDCAWPEVGGSGVVLAGGRYENLIDENGTTADWLFYGIVPQDAAEVVLTLADGRPMRIATRAADGAGDNRIYAHKQPGLTNDVKVVKVELHDATGGEIRVY